MITKINIAPIRKDELMMLLLNTGRCNHKMKGQKSAGKLGCDWVFDQESNIEANMLFMCVV